MLHRRNRLAASLGSLAAQPERKSNIVVIVADDRQQWNAVHPSLCFRALLLPLPRWTYDRTL